MPEGLSLTQNEAQQEPPGEIDYRMEYYGSRAERLTRREE